MILRQIVFWILFLFPFSFWSQTNSLVIFTATGNPFYLSVNQKQINAVLQSNIKVNDLKHGWQQIDVKLFKENEQLTLKDSIKLIDEPKYDYKEFTYVILEQEKKLQLQFISVSQTSGPDVPPVPEAPKEQIPLVDNSIYGNLYQAKNNKPIFYANYNSETGVCHTPLSDKDVKYGLNLLSKCNDDETQMLYLNQIILLNCYQVTQLYLLLDMAKIELDRLSLAKQAHNHITDKQNINALLPVFKYQKIKESYLAFLNDQETITKQQKLQCKEPMTESQFKDFYNKIKNTAYEYEKVNTAKKFLVNACISTTQTKQLLGLFSHDREKLELTACAYRVMTDKDQAKTLEEEFQFSESRIEFLKIITP